MADRLVLLFCWKAWFWLSLNFWTDDLTLFYPVITAELMTASCQVPVAVKHPKNISPLTHFTIFVRCLFKKRLLILWPDNLRFIYSDQNLPADLVLANCSFDLFWTAWTFSWHDSSEGQMCAILCWSAPLIVAVSKREQIFACLNMSRKSTVDCTRQLGTKVTRANSRTLLNWTQLWEPVIPPC